MASRLINTLLAETAGSRSFRFLLSDGLDFLPMNINSGHLLFPERIKTATDRTSAKADFDHIIQNIMSFLPEF